jgi:hypothetical protein
VFQEFGREPVEQRTFRDKPGGQELLLIGFRRAPGWGGAIDLDEQGAENVIRSDGDPKVALREGLGPAVPKPALKERAWLGSSGKARKLLANVSNVSRLNQTIPSPAKAPETTVALSSPCHSSSGS